jgi:hypothetical protein
MQPIEHAWAILKSGKAGMTQTDPGYPDPRAVLMEDGAFMSGKVPDMPGMGEMQTWRDQLRAKYEANRGMEAIGLNLKTQEGLNPTMQNLSHQDLLNAIAMARHHTAPVRSGHDLTPHPETGELIASPMQEHLEEAMHEYRLRIGEGTAKYPENLPSRYPAGTTTAMAVDNGD